jgi:DNA-binding CsgD family transcriptional regulator
VRAEIEVAQSAPERSSFDTFLVIQEVHLLVRLGRLAEARERLPARVPGEAISYASLFWREVRARLALLTGDLDGVRNEIAALERLSNAPAEPQWVEPRADVAVELALREDRLEDARTLVRGAARRIEHTDDATRLLRVGWMAERAEAEAAGRAQALGEPYAPALEDVAECVRERAQARPRFDEACAWGGMAAAERTRRRTLLGDAPADPSPWEEVARSFDALMLPIPATYARYRAAEAHVTAGDRAAATSLLRAAAEAAEAMGAALLAADIEALARRARIDLGAPAAEQAPEAADSPVARLGLTPRELEVLLLVAEGHTNRAIGETLFMSEKTASVHVSRILAKLGVGGRVEAAAVAHRLGLTAPARS